MLRAKGKLFVITGPVFTITFLSNIQERQPQHATILQNWWSPKMTKQTRKRLTMSIPAQAQERLRVAADLAGATLNQFVVQAALE